MQTLVQDLKRATVKPETGKQGDILASRNHSSWEQTMSAVKAFGVLSVLFALLTSPVAQAASESKPPMSLDEVSAKRRAVRQELMLPSLTGIHSIAYRVVGFKDYEPLEKIMGSKLAQLNISCDPMVKMASMKKGCDAIVQISFSKLGSHTVGELKVMQWATLERNPKIAIRAVTYSEKSFTKGKPDSVVEELTNEFVVDYLKANQAGFGNAGKPADKASPAKK